MESINLENQVNINKNFSSSSKRKSDLNVINSDTFKQDISNYFEFDVYIVYFNIFKYQGDNSND